MNDLRERWFLPVLQSALRILPVTVVIGARQTGKTTLVRQFSPRRTYHTLDDLGVLDQATRHPEALLADRPVTLDEVQRTPSLLLAVKRAVDERRIAGDFLLTGSANLLLGGRVADTLAGRAVYLTLPPFCPTEWQRRVGALTMIDRLFAPEFDYREWPNEPGDWTAWLLRGGFPSALALEADEDRAMWLGAYTQTYLERDLRQLSEVASLPDFQRLMVLAAHRTGRLVNQADLARDAGLSHPTAHRYLNLLEAGCLITRLRPYSSNASSQLVKAPKLQWMDCGLAAFLAGIRSRTEAARRPDSGFWLEQTLYQSLQAWASLAPLKRRIHFWRDRAGHEVDFIIEEEGRLVAIEVKTGAQAGMAETAGLRAFCASLKPRNSLARGVVLYAGRPRPLDASMVALPWGWLVPAV